MTPGQPIAEVTRRDVRTGQQLVESVHTGHLAVVAGDELLARLGDPDTVTFVRSAAKPFQATACLELLDLAGPQLSPPEIAVAWASHRGERVHVDQVVRILRRAGIGPARLTCPPAAPEADPGAVPAPVLHNCSGKHALFAVAGQQMGAPAERLLDPDGPLQRAVLGMLEDHLGPVVAAGTDGCGAPAVAVPLRSLATAYATIAASDRFARVRDAGFTHPGLVGGQGRLESALLAAGVVAKVGAEGVYAAGWVGRDGRPRGLAVKCADGAVRGAGAALLAVLTDLEVVAPDVWTAPPTLGGGRPVGGIRASRDVRDVVGRA